MAQIGCFVSASSANLPLFDAIFTRIGAADDIVSGQSTFMVEMSEVNNALSFATEKSEADQSEPKTKRPYNKRK